MPICSLDFCVYNQKRNTLSRIQQSSRALQSCMNSMPDVLFDSHTRLFDHDCLKEKNQKNLANQHKRKQCAMKAWLTSSKYLQADLPNFLSSWTRCLCLWTTVLLKKNFLVFCQLVFQQLSTCSKGEC